MGDDIIIMEPEVNCLTSLGCILTEYSHTVFTLDSVLLCQQNPHAKCPAPH